MYLRFFFLFFIETKKEEENNKTIIENHFVGKCNKINRKKIVYLVNLQVNLLHLNFVLSIRLCLLIFRVVCRLCAPGVLSTKRKCSIFDVDEKRADIQSKNNTYVGSCYCCCAIYIWK